MSDHRHVDASPEAQRATLLAIVADSPTLIRTFRIARNLALPDWWVVPGALYQQVWNALTGRPEITGVKDIDLFYWDPDTAWDAEDLAIARAARACPPEPHVELRNQARVPLWFESRFGHPYPSVANSAEGIGLFAARTHCLGLRLRPDDGFDVHAPYGPSDVFALRPTPYPRLPNRATYEAKAARQMAVWPELEVTPWPA